MVNHPNRSKIPATHEVRYWEDRAHSKPVQIIYRGNESTASKRFYDLIEECSSDEDCELVELFNEVE
jgi:hypothetical protein